MRWVQRRIIRVRILFPLGISNREEQEEDEDEEGEDAEEEEEKRRSEVSLQSIERAVALIFYRYMDVSNVIRLGAVA